MTRNGTRAAAVGTIASVLMLASILASVTARPVGGGRQYAVLSLPESYEDREAVGALSAAGIDGVVSESTQWVYMDAFDGFERVPLDRYRDRLESFDPRDDGYANRLRTLFVSGGQRRLFVPDASASRLKVIGALFPEGAYSLEAPAKRTGGLRELVLGVVAILLVLLVCGVPAIFSAAAPAFASLACFGSAGLAASALLASSIRLAVDPAREALRSGRGTPRLRERPWLFDGLIPAVLYGIGALAACIFGDIPIFPSLLSIAAGFAALFAVIEYQEYRRGLGGHERFAPVNLVHRFTGILTASRTAVPFAAVALLSSVLSLWGLGGTSASPVVSYTEVTIEDYRAHLEFQRSFSLLKLGSPVGASYSRYRMEGGLVAGDSELYHLPETGKLELPPAERMLSRTAPEPGAPRIASSAVGILVALVAALAAAAPAAAQALRARKRSRSVSSIVDKRIAA